MTEYIEKWQLLQMIRTLPTWFCDQGAKFFDGPQPPMEALLDPDEVIRTVAGMPSADVVEVVRCKDCIHNGSYDTDCPIDWNGKEYCSFAERRTNEQIQQLGL